MGRVDVLRTQVERMIVKNALSFVSLNSTLSSFHAYSSRLLRLSSLPLKHFTSKMHTEIKSSCYNSKVIIMHLMLNIGLDLSL